MKNIFIIFLFASSLLVKAQEQQQDTLIIKYNNKRIKRVQNPITKEYKYFIKDKDNDSEYMFFLEKKHIEI